MINLKSHYLVLLTKYYCAICKLFYYSQNHNFCNTKEQKAIVIDKFEVLDGLTSLQ